MLKQMIKDDSALGQMSDIVCSYANILLEELADVIKGVK
jgi:hypothetical protein